MEELDLKELLQVFWEKRAHMILIIAIFAVLGVIYTLTFITPKYQASTTLLLATNSSAGKTGAEAITTTDVNLNSKLVSTYRDLVTSKTLVRNVISNLALDIEEEDLKKSISVTARTDTEIIEISVKNEDPVLATKIANEIAKVYMNNIKEYYGRENVHVVDEAEVPQEPSNVNHVKDVIIFAFVGIVISIMYVLVANMLDTTIKSEQDIEKISGITVLATLPLYGRVDDRRKRGGRK